MHTIRQRHCIAAQNFLVAHERAVFGAKVLNGADTITAANLRMGTADDRVGDDDVCLRTLADHNLRVIVNCKTPVRV